MRLWKNHIFWQGFQKKRIGNRAGSFRRVCGMFLGNASRSRGESAFERVSERNVRRKVSLCHVVDNSRE